MQINKISKSKSFNGVETTFSKGLSGTLKLADLFVKSQENLSSTRFIQDTVTNWAPKAIFARSKADFAEMSFLEFLESGIFYFASPILGEKLFRKFSHLAPKAIKTRINSQIPNSVEEILKNKNITNEIKRHAISKKAGIVLACAAIPIAEYTLSFAKNLFTLKTFKKTNFNNIANLDKTKNEKEDKAHQQKVEKNAKRELKKAGILSLAGIFAGTALAIYGHKSNVLQTISKSILNPGKTLSSGFNKLGLHSKKIDKILNGLSLDFANNNGKLALSKGQLALTAILGLFGYSNAAKDRGKLDVLEVWTRVPLVVFYTIFGGELFEKVFIKILEKKGKYKELIQRSADGIINIPKRTELPALAEKLAKIRKTLPEQEYAKLLKGKAFITAVPYAFSLLFMGFTLSAITRFSTQYRYNHLEKENKTPVTFKGRKELPDVFKKFKI